MTGAVTNRLTYEDVYSPAHKLQKYVEGTIAIVNHPVYGTLEVMYSAAYEDIPYYGTVKFVPSLKADGTGFTFGAGMIMRTDLNIGNMTGNSICKDGVPSGYFSWYAIHGIFISPVTVTLVAGVRAGHPSSRDGAFASWAATRGSSTAISIVGDRTVVKNATIQNNSQEIYVASVANLAVSMAVTGSGIPATTYIQGIDEASNIVTLTKSATNTLTTQLTFDSNGTLHTNLIFQGRCAWQAAF